MKSTIIAITLTAYSASSIAASPSDIDKLTTYSVILGRAMACSINTKAAASQVGAWMDRVFPPGSSDQITYLPILMEGMKYNAEQQASGKSPDSCSAVLRAFNNTPWP